MKKKLKLGGIKNPMSRNEMKNVYAGTKMELDDAEVIAGGGGCLDRCSANSGCGNGCGVCRWYGGGTYCFSS
jgi:hypothetical protein